MMDIWSFTLVKAEASIGVIVLYVLHSEGSSPGRQGFKMAVAADGSLCGSIGGGIMEHKFVELAKSMLVRGKSTPGLFRQVHDKATSADQSGMICSGEQTIFLYPIRPNDVSEIQKIAHAVDTGKNGSIQVTPAGIRFMSDEPVVNFSFDKKSSDDFLYIEKTGRKNILHIIGGGHCSLALSRLMSRMDFCIHLYDDRPRLNTIIENEWVHRKHLLHSYAELSDLPDGVDNVYVVVMTIGYRTDQMVLRVLHKKQFRYVGVLGSKTKMEKLLGELGEELDPAFVKKIKTPAGIPIRSQTPDEIAVSIAAQIIAEKNKDQ